MNIFSWLGAGLAAVGVALGLAAIFATGEAQGGLLIAGLSILPTGAIFYFTGRRVGSFRGLRPGLLETGLPHRGLVKKLWETGVTINNNPVLGFEIDVVSKKHKPYSVTVQQTIPRLLVGAVLPGSVLGVEVDPNDREEIAIDWSIAPEAPSFHAKAGGESSGLAGLPSRSRSMDDLLASGRRAKATIASMRRMGRIGDLGLADPEDERSDDELFLVELDVKMAGRDPFPTRVLHRVPDELVGRVGPGLELEVAVDRENPDEEVAIDWDSAGIL